MEARKRKMEEGKIGGEVGRRAGEKNGTNEGRDVLENAHANGRGFTAKVSRGNERYVRSTSASEQTNPHRSIDPEPARLVSFAFFFPLSFSLFTKSRSGGLYFSVEA